MKITKMLAVQVKGKRDGYLATLERDGKIALTRIGQYSNDTVTFFPDDVPEIIKAIGACANEAGVA